MRYHWRYLLAALFFFASTCIHGEVATAQDDSTKKVLILNSYHPGYAWSDVEQAGIVDTFRAQDSNWVPFIEYLDCKRHPRGEHLEELARLLRIKYHDQDLSLVITLDNPALEFIMQDQMKLFGNSPVVFCGINNFRPAMIKGHSNITGRAENIDIRGTIEVMLRLHPAAREILVLHDYTVTGLAVRKEVEDLIPRFSARVKFRFNDQLDMNDLLKEIERLPKDSLVLEIGFITDKSGRTFDLTETTDLFVKHSPVPVYGAYEARLGHGIIGGKLISARIHGANTAVTALRVLAGEKASNIPVETESDAQFMFDHRAMARVGIPLSALPENSIVINQPVSFYTTHRTVIQYASAAIFFLCAIIGLLTINIVQRRRSEEALRESEIQKKAILDGITAQIIFLNKDLEIQWANAAAGESVDKSPEELVGHNCYEFWGNPEKPCENCSTVNVFKTNKPNQGLKHFPDGRILETRGEPVFYDDGNLMGVVEISLDITEKTRMEAQLQRAQTLESVSILAGGIAHDFNNLLSVIMGNISMTKDDVKPEYGVTEFLNEAEEASLLARDLTKQLIIFSKGGAPVKEVSSIEILVKETTNLILSDSNVKSEFIFPDDLRLVEFDEGQMKHAVKNLIVNAVESMSDGGSIVLKTENFNISLGTIEKSLPLSEGKYVKISIQDHGVGIPEEHLSKIFDPYFSTKERGIEKGMGLGLATTYSIINKHDGHITVESEVGVGTTFILYLPAHEKDAKKVKLKEISKPEKSAIRTGRILLMDDEKSIREVTKQMLSRLGYDPDFAKDGTEAIELYQEAIESGKPFEAVILDLTIKEGMGGVDTIKKLMEIDPQVRAIVSSGYSNDPVMTDFRKYGFIGALAKPYTKRHLSETLIKITND